MIKEEPIKFFLLKIKAEQFALFEDKFSEGKQVNLSTSIRFKINRANTQLGTFVEYKFSHKKDIFIAIQVSCHFKIHEDSWKTFINLSKNGIIIPRSFLTHMAMITVGTTRGILFTKTEGTSFNKFIIPTTNLTKIITEDLKFHLKKPNRD